MKKQIKTIGKYDEEYRLKILHLLAETAPTYREAMEPLKKMIGEDKEKYAANMLYLEQEGLVESLVKIGIDGYISYALPPRLTSAGVNFLSGKDIRSTLEALSLKIHEDARNQLSAAIEQSQIESVDKETLLERVKKLPIDVAVSLVSGGLLLALQKLIQS